MRKFTIFALLLILKLEKANKSFIFFAILFLYAVTSNISYSQYWFEDTSGVNVRLNAVYCLNMSRAWCCGNNGTVLRLTPIYWNMQRWKNVTGNGIPVNLDLVSITNPWSDTNIALTTGTVAGVTYVYRTSNAGANWTQVFSQPNGKINSVWFSQNSNTNAFLQGDPVGGRWTIFRSTNGGVNWDSSGLFLQQNGSEIGWSNSAYFYNDRVWFGTNNSRIYYSSNSGITWSSQSILPEFNSYTIMANIPSGVVISGGSTLMKSTSHGMNWSPIASMGTGNFGGFGNWGNFWWYVRSDNKVYLSSNNGESWSVQYTAQSGNFTNIYLTNYNLLMFAIRTNGGISRYIIAVGIHQISNQTPENFSLSQNYPNPFNPVTKIKFDVPKTSFTKIIIYDIIGREVTTLVNEELKPGTYEVDWNSAGFSSGVYFYKITAGDYSETKKMVLMK